MEKEIIEPTFIRSQETMDYSPDKTTNKQWEAIRDECISGGVMDDRCSIITSSLNGGSLEVVAKKLRCGCQLILVDGDGDVV